MADREKVIKGLECCAIGLYCPDEDCPYEEAREAKDENCIAMLARDALELLKAQEPGWIRAEYRLPEDNSFVLVCNDDGHMMIAQYIAETMEWQYKYTNYDVDLWDNEEQGPVLWWMPLPEPPKEGR